MTLGLSALITLQSSASLLDDPETWTKSEKLVGSALGGFFLLAIFLFLFFYASGAKQGIGSGTSYRSMSANSRKIGFNNKRGGLMGYGRNKFSGRGSRGSW